MCIVTHDSNSFWEAYKILMCTFRWKSGLVLWLAVKATHKPSSISYDRRALAFYSSDGGISTWAHATDFSVCWSFVKDLAESQINVIVHQRTMLNTLLVQIQTWTEQALTTQCGKDSRRPFGGCTINWTSNRGSEMQHLDVTLEVLIIAPLILALISQWCVYSSVARNGCKVIILTKIS